MSPDAEYMARSLFFLTGSMVFHMKEAKPTARTQAALDELVKEGVLSVEPYNQAGGLHYKRISNPFNKAATLKMHNEIGKGWNITEPV